MRTNVSIIIPCRNEENYIENAIRSILTQASDKINIEIIIIDGISEDNTQTIIQSIIANDSRVRLFLNHAKTTPQAMNIGISNAQYPYIIRIDAHAEAKEGFIEKSIQAIQSDDTIDCAGGKIINIYENPIAKSIGKAMSSKFGVGNATFRIGGERKFVDTVAFGIYKKAIFERIGMFDERLVRNQDDELNYRIIQSGGKILYDPQIESLYYVRGSFIKLAKQYFQYGYWKIFVNKKHNAVTSIRQLFPFLFILGLLVGGIASFFHKIIFMLFASVICFYAVVCIILGLKLGDELKDKIQVMMVFPILHISYGWGYLIGLIDFILLNKKITKKATEITR